MGKTFRKNSDDFHKRKSAYENKNCGKKWDFFDPDLIEDVKSTIDSNNRKSNNYELYNDCKRR